MRAAALIVSAILLAGCFPDKEKAAAEPEPKTIIEKADDAVEPKK